MRPLAINVVPHNALLALGQVRSVAALNIVGGLVLVGVMAILIPHSGLVGAAIGRAIYTTLLTIAYLIACRKAFTSKVTLAHARSRNTIDSKITQMVHESTNSRIGSLPLAFWFWMLTITRFSFALLFFRENPVAATGVGSALSVLFAYCIVLAILQIKIKTTFLNWPSIVKWISLYVAWCAVSLLLDALGIFDFRVWLLDNHDAGFLIVAAMVKWGDTEAIVPGVSQSMIAGCGAIALIALLFTSNSDGRWGMWIFFIPLSWEIMPPSAFLSSIYFWLRTRTQVGREHWYWAGCALFMTWILILSVSKTSIVGLVLALASFFFLRRELRSKQKWWSCFSERTTIAAMYGSLSAYLTEYGDNTKDVTTLTGRTVLWAKAWEMIEDHPIVGYGFLSFRDYGHKIGM